ncbi:hypothetical protein GCM10007053_09970 [Halioglobus pacificus]|uniref:Uncharacterized protein n=1 Tax=Parahalioglobus pacificus TaxID=930806 RepID=A0A919CIX6_9GAMM|nr:hypothetical protein GCM10007053_09970 [Halioglobus pacificus]
MLTPRIECLKFGGVEAEASSRQVIGDSDGIFPNGLDIQHGIPNVTIKKRGASVLDFRGLVTGLARLVIAARGAGIQLRKRVSCMAHPAASTQARALKMI